MKEMSREELEQKVINQASNIKEMEELIYNQKTQLRFIQKSLEEKNKVLDALHYVWCDGGCPGGVHRYDSMKDIELTEDIVKKAERNTYRLRMWFVNYNFRKQSSDKKHRYFKSWKYRIKHIVRKIYFSL